MQKENTETDTLIQSHNGNPVDNLAAQAQISPKRTKAVKQRITVQISFDVIERLKNAVYWTPGLTIASLAEEAFSNAVDMLEKENVTFPHRKEELKTGRPIS